MNEYEKKMKKIEDRVKIPKNKIIFVQSLRPSRETVMDLYEYVKGRDKEIVRALMLPRRLVTWKMKTKC